MYTKQPKLCPISLVTVLMPSTYSNSLESSLSPAATSTPNPIQQQQQQQQNILSNQDIITNLFLKFDPVQLLQQKVI